MSRSVLACCPFCAAAACCWWTLASTRTPRLSSRHGSRCRPARPVATKAEAALAPLRPPRRPPKWPRRLLGRRLARAMHHPAHARRA